MALGMQAVTACLSVSLPELPGSVQERNASLLEGLQCFDVRFQMELHPPKAWREKKTKLLQPTEKVPKNSRSVFLYAGHCFCDRIIFTKFSQKNLIESRSENKDGGYLSFFNISDV